jgi:hypothetical protein
VAKQKTLPEPSTGVREQRVSSPTARKDLHTQVSGEYVHSLRGKLKGKGLLNALLKEKELEKHR